MLKSKRNNLIFILVVAFAVAFGTFLCSIQLNKKVVLADAMSVEDLYFTPGARLSATDLSIMSFQLNLSESAYDNVEIESIEIEFDTEDGSLKNCYIDYPSLSIDDFDYYGNSYATEVVVNVLNFNQGVKLKATVNYVDNDENKTLTAVSLKRSILELLRSMDNAGAIEDYFEEEGNTYNTVCKILEADNDGFSLKAESAVYNNIFKYSYEENLGAGDGGFYEGIENTLVIIDNAEAIYRVKHQKDINSDIRIMFSFAHESVTKKLNLYVEEKIVRIDNPISSILSDLEFKYWSNDEYYYFQFGFIEDINNNFSNLAVESWDTDIDVGLNAADTEYTNSLLAEIEQLKARYDEQLALVEQKEKEKNEIYERINSLESEIEELNQEIETLTNDYETQIATLTQEHESEIQRLNEEHSAEIESLTETSAEEIEELKEAHQTEIDELNAQYEQELEEANTVYNSNLTKLSEELEELTSNYDSLVIEKQNLEEQLDALGSSLEGDNSELIALNQKLVSEKNQLVKEKEELQEENSELKKQLAELQQKEDAEFSIGCGSVSNGKGSGSSGGMGFTTMLTLIGMATLYTGVQYARKKNNNS